MKEMNTYAEVVAPDREPSDIVQGHALGKGQRDVLVAVRPQGTLPEVAHKMFRHHH